MKRMHVTRTRLGILLAVFAGVALGAVFGQPGNSQASTSAVPTNKTLPTITGSPEAGQVLAGHRGTWNNAPKTFSYSWSRCDTSGNGCVAIGANARLYTVSATDVGHTLRVTVTARNASGAGHATSAPTAIVTPTGCPVGSGAISIGALAPPARLQIGNNSIAPAVTRSTRTIHMHFVITACGGRPVQGAIVYATPIPFNQFGGASVTTDANGAVTITENRQGGFPVSRKQQLLAVYARASAPGQPATSGVSTSRLVSFPISH